MLGKFCGSISVIKDASMRGVFCGNFDRMLFLVKVGCECGGAAGGCKLYSVIVHEADVATGESSLRAICEGDLRELGGDDEVF